MKNTKLLGSHIENFDAALGGGVPEGHIVLVYGGAGTMKSSICFNILFNETLGGKKGVYISIEQNSLSLLKQMVSIGIEIPKVNIEVLNGANDVLKGIKKMKDSEPNKLTIVDFGTIRKELGMPTKTTSKAHFAFSDDIVNTILTIARTLAEKKLCDIVVIDSLTALYSLTELKNPRSEIFYLFEYLREIGLTAFIISEEVEFDAPHSGLGIENYLVDGIIHLHHSERNRKVIREISVVKMRAMACNNDIYSLEFDGKKFRSLYGGKVPLV